MDNSIASRDLLDRFVHSGYFDVVMRIDMFLLRNVCSLYPIYPHFSQGREAGWLAHIFREGCDPCQGSVW